MGCGESSSNHKRGRTVGDSNVATKDVNTYRLRPQTLRNHSLRRGHLHLHFLQAVEIPCRQGLRVTFEHCYIVVYLHFFFV